MMIEGDSLKDRRERAGFSVEEIAEIAALRPRTVERHEAGLLPPWHYTRGPILEALELAEWWREEEMRAARAAPEPAPFTAPPLRRCADCGAPFFHRCARCAPTATV